MKITTINSLHEALISDEPLSKVLISEKRRDNRIKKIIEICREKGVPFIVVPHAAITRKGGKDHQGVFAEISPVKFYPLEEIIKGNNEGMILILDSITDAGNLGAIIRSSVASGVDGIILSRWNSAPINETVLKASSGALLKTKIVLTKNISREIKLLKEKGYWIIATSVNSGIPYFEYEFNISTALIMGSEKRGISTIVKKHTDQFITIPHSGKIESLNVSAAAAVILFEALRQKTPRN